MALGRTGLSVSFLRVNKSTILAAFQNLTLAQVEAIVAAVKIEYPFLDNESDYSTSDPYYHNFTIQNMHASSVSDGTIPGAVGYYILQIDNIGTPIPWGVTEFIIREVNSLQITGSVTVQETPAESSESTEP